jgi:hypothetical protein
VISAELCLRINSIATFAIRSTKTPTRGRTWMDLRGLGATVVRSGTTPSTSLNWTKTPITIVLTVARTVVIEHCVDSL